MPNPKITITRDCELDDDGEVEEHGCELSVEISDGYIYVELTGTEYDDDYNLRRFYNIMTMCRPEARQLRDFLNANVKGD